MQAVFFLTALIITLSACSKRKDQVAAEKPEAATQVASPQIVDPPKATVVEPAKGVTNTSISFQNEILAQYVTKLEDARYSFTYMNVKRTGEFEVSSDTTSVTLNDLPTGEKGTATIEIFEGGKIKLRGTAEELSLVSGINTIDMVLKKVEDDGDDQKDATDTGSNDSSDSDSGNRSIPLPNPGSGDALAVPDAIEHVLVEHCVECHHTGAVSPNLHRISGDPKDVKLMFERALELASGKHEPRMPPAPRDLLSSDDIAKIRAWIGSL